MASKLFSLGVISAIFGVILMTSRCEGDDTQFKSKEQIANQISERFLGNTPKDKTADRSARLKRQVFTKYYTPAPYQYNVIYVIDSSSSIKNVDFKLALKAIEHLTMKARQDTRYAAVMFASYSQVISTFTSPQDIMKKLQSVHRLRGGTNIYDALQTCQELFNNPSSGSNPKALNRILIITDGLCNIKQSRTLSLALELKLNNTEIFVVAVGHYMYGLTEISFLASSQESHVFRVKTMKGLFDVTKWIPQDFYNGNRDNDNRGNSDSNDVW